MLLCLWRLFKQMTLSEGEDCKAHNGFGRTKASGMDWVNVLYNSHNRRRKSSRTIFPSSQQFRLISSSPLQHKLDQPNKTEINNRKFPSSEQSCMARTIIDVWNTKLCDNHQSHRRENFLLVRKYKDWKFVKSQLIWQVREDISEPNYSEVSELINNSCAVSSSSSKISQTPRIKHSIYRNGSKRKAVKCFEMGFFLCAVHWIDIRLTTHFLVHWEQIESLKAHLSDSFLHWTSHSETNNGENNGNALKAENSKRSLPPNPNLRVLQGPLIQRRSLEALPPWDFRRDI